MPSCLASPSTTQRRRSSLGSDAGHARVCRPQPLFMHLTAFSPTSWCGLKPVVLLRPPRPRWLFGSPAASREGQRGRGAARIRHLDDHDYGDESRRSTSGTPRPIPRSPSRISAAADEPPGRLAVLLLFPCLFRKPNCLLLIRPDRPSYRLLHVNQREPEAAVLPQPLSGPVALSNLACRP